MKEYERIIGVNQEQKNEMYRIFNVIIRDVLEWKNILPKEKYSPGMMNGISGIGLVLSEIKL